VDSIKATYSLTEKLTMRSSFPQLKFLPTAVWPRGGSRRSGRCGSGIGI